MAASGQHSHNGTSEKINATHSEKHSVKTVICRFPIHIIPHRALSRQQKNAAHTGATLVAVMLPVSRWHGIAVFAGRTDIKIRDHLQEGSEPAIFPGASHAVMIEAPFCHEFQNDPLKHLYE